MFRIKIKNFEIGFLKTGLERFEAKYGIYFAFRPIVLWVITNGPFSRFQKSAFFGYLLGINNEKPHWMFKWFRHRNSWGKNA